MSFDLSFRPKPVVYPQSYIDILEGEVVDISRALGTSYWFDDDNDDDENNQRSAAWEEDEYEIVSASTKNISRRNDFI